MAQITLADGARFAAEPGVTVLDAALAQGVILGHSCRTGRCGSCKARLVSGEVQLVRAAEALSTQEAQDGWILTCAHAAQGDLQLDIEALNALSGISIKTLPARIDHLEYLAPDVLRVVLRLPPTANFRFLAGQYIDVTSPGGVKRSYSLASDAAHTHKLELQIRRVDQGQFSAYWFEQAQFNDLLRFNGPLGTFFMRPLAGLDLVFLATGTGIAPIQAMLQQLTRLAEAERPASVTLYWGGRQAQDLYWDPLPEWPSLRYVPVLSRGDADWAGARGHVQDVMLASQPGLTNTVVYACGSEQMIHAAQQQLVAAGLPLKRFFFDAFVSSN